MVYLILLLGALLGIGLNVLITVKFPARIEKYFKILSVLLFAIYAVRLFSEDVFNQTFNLLYVDVVTQINADSTWVLSRNMSILMVFLRWLTMLGIVWGVVSAFYKQRFLRFYMATVGLAVGILNILYFKENITAFLGVYKPFSYRTIEFAAETIVFMALVSMNIVMIFKEKIKPKWRDLGNLALITLISSLAIMPLTTLYNLLGKYGDTTDDFNIEHIICVALPFVIMLVSYFTMFKKRQED